MYFTFQIYCIKIWWSLKTDSTVRQYNEASQVTASSESV